MVFGGELIIYAPQVKDLGHGHEQLLEKIGYHVLDYFEKQKDKFADIPRAILAHSTHIRGLGTYENNVEKARIKVTLASSIPKSRLEPLNLSCQDPKSLNLSALEKDPECLLVNPAGEDLYQVS